MIQTIASFADSGGRTTVSLSAVASAYRDVRVRVSYPTTSPTLVKCSNDSFAIRPTGFTVSSANATNNGTSGTPTFAAGSGAFNLSATSAAGYDGTPSIDNAKIVGTPNAGTISGSFGAAPSGTGTASGAAFTYSEVGNFGLNADAVVDASFTSIDGASDCVSGSTSNTVASGKYGCSIGSAAVAQTTGSSGFGRFIPANFNVTLNSPTFAAACGTFSYVGQVFSYGTAPVMTVTARNSSNATTTNYAGAYMKLTNASLPGNQAARYSRVDTLGGGLTPALDTGGLPATTADPAIGTFTSGEGLLTFSSGSGLGFTRSTTTPNAPFDADIALALNVIDTDSVAYGGNPKSTGTMSFSGGANNMRFGRLRIVNATGVATSTLIVPIRTEYWTGTGFALNTSDSCTTLNRANIALGTYAKSLNACETRVTTDPVIFASGAGTLRLSAAGAGNEGSVTLTPQLQLAAPTAPTDRYCSTVGVSDAAASGADKSYLQGAWGVSTYTQNPAARAAFGTYGAQPRNFIFFREN